MLRKVFIVMFLLAIAACEKPIVEVDTNYIGIWIGGNNGTHYLILIDSNGEGYYHRDFYGGSEAEEDWKGNIKASNTQIKFGNSPSFKILESPTPIDTNILNYNLDTVRWEMRLKYPHTIGYDGAEFTLYR